LRSGSASDFGMDNRFEAGEWITLSRAERIKRCRLLADEAMALVALESGSLAPHYAEIARQWRTLADDMERQDQGAPLGVAASGRE
jgi:hypothetical protein